MRRLLLAAACILLLPAFAAAQSYTASLSGTAGSGFGTITINGETINYTILASGFAPSSAVLTDGSDEIDLGVTFTAGSASGSTTSGMAPDVASDPSAWTLEVSDGTDTISGSLSSGGSGTATELYFPVAASNPGANQTFFRTDARLINRSGQAATATLEFYRNDAGGNTAPDATETVNLGVNEQAVLEDFVVNLFGFSTAQGAVKITSDRSILAASRVYNDQTSVGTGTKGVFVNGVSKDQAYRNGTISFLENANRNSGAGFRGAIGWFNPNSSSITVTLSGWDTDGTLLGSETVTVAGLEQKQQFIQAIWPALAGYGDMYVTYTASGDVFVYGTITDNNVESGDGTYIPAAQGN
jgi:hypothetical protein